MRKTVFAGVAVAGAFSLLAATAGAASDTTVSGSEEVALQDVATCASAVSLKAPAESEAIRAAVERAQAELEELAGNPALVRLEGANDELVAQEGLVGAAQEACTEIEDEAELAEAAETPEVATSPRAEIETAEPAETEDHDRVETHRAGTSEPEQEHSGGSGDSGSDD